jgi:YbbR domain-containing protein
MPFTEIEDAPNRVPRPPSAGRRWLREIFVEDWNLKLLALAITLGLWYAVAGQRTPTTIRLRGVHLSFQLTNEMEISNDPREEVEVELMGDKSVLERINARDLVASVDLSGYKPGERVVPLTPNRVVMELPNGVSLNALEPSVVPLRLEPRVEREVEVEADLEGRPEDGYELRGVTSSPVKIRVRGPASHVNAIEKAHTETILLDGRKESFSAQQTAIDISDTKVDVIDTIVNVYINISPQRIERTFTGVAIGENSALNARAKTVTVTLYGEKDALDALRAEDIQIIYDTTADGANVPRLVLPSGAGGRVELRSVKR